MADDASVPSLPYNPNDGFTFYNRWPSMEVVNGRSIICRHTSNGTTYSQQVFRGNMNFRATLRMTDTKIGYACGIVGAQSTRQTANHMVGGKEIGDSIGCVILQDSVQIIFRTEVLFSSKFTMKTA